MLIDQAGYWSGAQFDRTSRTDDQLPITARPLVTGAADSAGVGVRGTATDDRGVGAMGAAAGMAGGGWRRRVGLPRLGCSGGAEVRILLLVSQYVVCGKKQGVLGGRLHDRRLRREFIVSMVPFRSAALACSFRRSSQSCRGALYRYRQQMEVYKQTQAAAGLAGAAGAGSGVRGGGADTQPG